MARKNDGKKMTERRAKQVEWLAAKLVAEAKARAADPEAGWGDAGSLGHAVEKLAELGDFLFGADEEGETFAAVEKAVR